MQVRRLAWAGVEATLDGTRVLIDPLENVARFARTGMGPARRPVPPIAMGPGTHALVTHIHGDHFDRDLLVGLAGVGTVGCHAPIQQAIQDAVAAAGVEAVGQNLGQPRRIGPLTVTPVPSLDWKADDQVAWVVEGGGRRVIHCGDTMWHGSWWDIARDHGPFDVAFLPINGVLVRSDSVTPVRVPVTMTPEQAIEAAFVLGARAACAIHHGVFDNPPTYVEQPDAERRFRQAGDERGITAMLLAAGELVPWT